MPIVGQEKTRISLPSGDERMPNDVIADRYRIIKEEFHDSLCTVYDALDQQNNFPVTVKVLSEDLKRDSLEKLLRFRKQIDGISATGHSNLQRIYAHGEFEDREYVVTEDVERARSLVQYFREANDIDMAVSIVLQIASGLAAAHEKGITHQGINPARILVFQDGGDGVTAKLADFGIPLLLDLAGIKEEGEVVRTFGYMSPEATGILRKPVDERSDIYSLGIIFYQLITGCLPYDGKDMSTLVHQHIAKKPCPPRELNPAVPPVLERVILRLMAKDPLDRYQTVSGLAADLEEYQRQRIEGKEIPNFEIARSDRAGELTYTTRLIGRREYLDTLQTLVAQGRESKGGFCAIHGESGVGKSRLLEELRDHILSTGGIFTAGKGYKSDVAVPYKAFIEIIETYMERLKRLSKEERESAVKRIKENLGELAGEIVKLAPGVVEFIGEPPELVAMDADKAKIRFLMTVTNFFLNLGTPEAPLTIAIDDAQWADAGSMELLGRIAEQAGTHPIVLLAVFADGDTAQDHPVRQVIKAVNDKQAVHDMPVGHFGIEETARLISEILRENQEDVLPLAQEVQERTRGNIYFILELLRSMVDGGIVRFEDNHYRYDLAKLRQASLPTDIVEVVIKRVNDIDEEVQRPLSYASIMGRYIDLELLARLTGLSEVFVLGALEVGIKNQFLGRDNESIFFVHDRIQEAFYEKVPENERKSLHRSMGEYIEEQNKDSLEPVLFELAHHFARAKIDDKTIAYSIHAGKEAQKSSASDQAIRFYEQARGILERQGATASDDYIDLLENLGSVYKTAGKFDESLAVLKSCEELIPKKDIIRRAEVLSKAGEALWEKGEGERATQLMGEALKSLGVKLPRNILGVLAGLFKESLIQGLHTLLPGIFVRKEYKHDQRKAVIVRLLLRTAYFYYFTDLLRTLHLGMKYLNMGERMGPSRLLSNIYSTHTVILAGFPLVAGRAKRDAKLSVRIAEGLHDRGAEGSAYGYYAVSTYSNRDVQEAYDYALKSIDILKGIGEYWDLGMGLYYRPACGVLLGKRFETLLQEVEEMIQIAESSHSLQALGWGRYHKARLLALIGDERLTAEGIQSGEEGVETMERVKDKATCLQGRSYLAFAHLRAGNYDEALRITEEVAGRYLRENNAAAFIHDVFPLSAQVYLECVRHKAGLTEAEKKKYLKKAKLFCGLSSHLKRFFPYLSSHAFHVNGTYQLLNGNRKKAFAIWEEGIAYIRNRTKDTYRLASILAERAECLLEDNPNDAKAREDLYEAKELFTQVGAKLDIAKIDRLLGIETQGAEVLDFRQTLTLTRQLDSLLSVTKAIGSVFILQELLEKIVDQAMKVTGAERGFLLLYDEQDGTLRQKVSKGLTEAEMAGKAFSFANCRISLALVQEVEKTREGLVEGQNEAAFPKIVSELKEYEVKEAICVPLRAKDKALGMIYLDNRMASGIFGPEELKLMSSFAVQASISIENAFLVGNMVEQQRLQQEMAVGKEIQSSLMPQQAPKVEGLIVDGLSIPAKEIGGDYYDFIAADEGNSLFIVIGDVSGKGVGAGLCMAMAKAAMFTITREPDAAPLETLARTNTLIYEYLVGQRFMTMLLMKWDAKEKKLLYSSAGHEHILVYRKDPQPASESPVDSYLSGGMMLGVLDDLTPMLEETEIPLNSGDKIVLYTDGVTEARNIKEELFTLERVIGLVAKHGQKPCTELMNSIKEDVYAFMGEREQPDDFTMVVIEVE